MVKKDGKRYDSNGRLLHMREGQRPDGKYYYSYVDLDRKRRTVSADSLKELREIEAYVLYDQADGISRYTSGKETLNWAFDRYMLVHKGLRESTRVGYRDKYDLYVRDSIGKRPVGEIRYSDVKEFYIGLFEEYGLAYGSVVGINTLIHPVFEMLVRDDVIRRNPADKAISELAREYRDRKTVRHALTAEQTRIFLNAALNNPYYRRFYPLFVTLFGTGCRIGEIAGLTWDRLDFENRTITIDRTLNYRKMENGRQEYHISTTKTDNGIRHIPMTDKVFEAFAEEFAYQEKYGRIRTKIDGVDGFVFGGCNNQPMRTEVANRMIRRVVEGYNKEEQELAGKEKREPVLLPVFTCHVCRHTFCTRLCEAGISVRVLMEIMGHGDVKTTMNVYAEISKEKISETAAEISEMDVLF